MPGFSKGFTVVELLVSIAIFALLSGLTIAGFRSAEETRELSAAAESVSAALRDAELRNRAVSFVVNDTAAVIFVDADGNNILGGGEAIETIALSPSGRVSLYKIVPTATSGATVVETNGAPVINGDPTIQTLTITLIHATTNKTKVVVLNRLTGVVDIQ